jgi:hypothetical protein
VSLTREAIPSRTPRDSFTVMRYSIECPVEGKVRFRQKTKVNWGAKTVYFERDDAGMLEKVRIEGPVPENDEIVATIEESPDGLTHFSRTGGTGLHRALVAELQSLESVFSFYYNLDRIRWDSPKCSIIPETPLEEARIEFNNVRVRREPPDPVTDMDLDVFPRLVRLALKSKHLASPLAFHREGRMDMKNLRYITAYFSYYFVLEGLYANGKWRSEAVEAEFNRSKALRGAIQQCVSHGLPKTAMGDAYTVEGLLASKAKRLTVENIIWLLVQTRGDLHHFVNSPTKPSGTPLTHDRYEVLAMFIGKISHLVLLEEINAAIGYARQTDAP